MNTRIVVKLFDRKNRKFKYAGLRNKTEMKTWVDTVNMRKYSICRVYTGKDARDVIECRVVVENMRAR